MHRLRQAIVLAAVSLSAFGTVGTEAGEVMSERGSHGGLASKRMSLVAGDRVIVRYTSYGPAPAGPSGTPAAVIWLKRWPLTLMAERNYPQARITNLANGEVTLVAGSSGWFVVEAVQLPYCTRTYRRSSYTTRRKRWRRDWKCPASHQIWRVTSERVEKDVPPVPPSSRANGRPEPAQ